MGLRGGNKPKTFSGELWKPLLKTPVTWNYTHEFHMRLVHSVWPTAGRGPKQAEPNPLPLHSLDDNKEVRGEVAWPPVPVP